MNKLYFGDNLEILREIDDARVDLICTDPPFNSGRDYNAFLGDSLAQRKHLPTFGHGTPPLRNHARIFNSVHWIVTPTRHLTNACGVMTLCFGVLCLVTKGQCVLISRSWDRDLQRCTAFSTKMALFISTAIRLLLTT